MKKTIVVAVSNQKRSVGKTIGVFDTCIRAMQKLNVVARCCHFRAKCSKETI